MAERLVIEHQQEEIRQRHRAQFRTVADAPVQIRKHQHAQFSRIVQGVVDIVRFPQQILLGHNGDIIFHLAVVLIDVHTAVQHFCLGRLIASNRIDQRCLAGAGSAQQQHQLAGKNGHIDISQKHLHAVETGPGRTLLQCDDQFLADCSLKGIDQPARHVNQLPLHLFLVLGIELLLQSHLFRHVTIDRVEDMLIGSRFAQH